MKNAGVVRGGERVGHADRDIDHVGDRHWLMRRHSIAQRLSFDVLRGDEVTIGVFADFVNRQDVRMIERRGSTRFALKSAHPFFVVGESFGQKFECDFALQRGVFGEIDLAHSAHTDEAIHSVV